MKSTKADLNKRGMPENELILDLSHMPFQDRVESLQSDDACVRSAAAINLRGYADQAADALLARLAEETCLYTKIAIGETLAAGGTDCARKMAEQLGRIGSNQHRTCPKKPSIKKSYPLPRDIIARYLGRMDPVIFPVILKVLESGDALKIREALDAAGYMVFYHPKLAVHEHFKAIERLTEAFREDTVVLWKAMMCLSAFPLEESRELLLRYADRESVIGAEAGRSLSILQDRLIPR